MAMSNTLKPHGSLLALTAAVVAPPAPRPAGHDPLLHGPAPEPVVAGVVGTKSLPTTSGATRSTPPRAWKARAKSAASMFRPTPMT